MREIAMGTPPRRRAGVSGQAFETPATGPAGAAASGQDQFEPPPSDRCAEIDRHPSFQHGGGEPGRLRHRLVLPGPRAQGIHLSQRLGLELFPGRCAADCSAREQEAHRTSQTVPGPDERAGIAALTEDHVVASDGDLVAEIRRTGSGGEFTFANKIGRVLDALDINLFT
jgi:hypothetical protein